MTEQSSLDAALGAALRAVDRALANEMQTVDGASAQSYLERLRDELEAMRARGSVGPDELRATIRTVATWAPEDDVSLLSALGLIARARGAG